MQNTLKRWKNQMYPISCLLGLLILLSPQASHALKHRLSDQELADIIKTFKMDKFENGDVINLNEIKKIISKIHHAANTTNGAEKPKHADELFHKMILLKDSFKNDEARFRRIQKSCYKEYKVQQGNHNAKVFKAKPQSPPVKRTQVRTNPTDFSKAERIEFPDFTKTKNNEIKEGTQGNPTKESKLKTKGPVPEARPQAHAPPIPIRSKNAIKVYEELCQNPEQIIEIIIDEST